MHVICHPATGVCVGKGVKAKGSSHQKPTLVAKKDEFEDLCDPREAICMYPQSSDRLKETGIPMDLQVQREQATTHNGASVYKGRYEKCAATAYFAQNPASLYSHVRRKHLGIVLACPYCSAACKGRGSCPERPTHPEALEKYKSAFKQPAPHIVASQDLFVNLPAVQRLAEEMVFG